MECLRLHGGQLFSLGPEFQPFPASAMPSTALSRTGTTQAGTCWGESLL